MEIRISERYDQSVLFFFLDFRHVIAETPVNKGLTPKKALLFKNAIELHLNAQKMGNIFLKNAKMSEVEK